VATNPKEFRVKNGLEITAGPIKINGSTGTSGQVISSTGTGVEWTAATAGSGSVTSITAGTGLSVSGGANPITTSGTITIDSTVATLTGTQTLTNKTLTSPTLTTPALGTPASGTLTNCTFPTLNQNTTGSAGSVANTLTITSPLSGTSYNGSAAVSIGIPVATTSVNGYLSSTDWTTFNNKGSGTVTSIGSTTLTTGGTSAVPTVNLTSGIVTAGTTGSASLIPVVTVDTYGRVTAITTAANPQGTVTSVTGTSPVVSTGGATPAISMPAASSGVNGYMTGTYATKLDGITAGATSNSGTVTSVSGTGNVSGITLTGTVTGSGSLTLGGSIGTLNQNTTGYAGYLNTTNQGLTGSTGLTTVSSTTAWSNYPIGYSAMFNTGQTATGAPSSNYGFFIKIANRDAGGGWGGIWTDYSGGDTYVGNTTVSSSYATWYKLLSSTNYNSYAPTLTGTGASGTWGISISGSAPAGSLTGATLASGVTASSLTSVGTLGSLTVSGRISVGDSVAQIYQDGTRLKVRSESTDDVVHFASYGMYFPKVGQTYNLYLAEGLQMGYGTASPYLSYRTGDLIFRSDATERMRLTAGGSLGIGTSSPATKLHIEAPTVSYGQVRLLNSSGSGETSINIGRTGQTLEQRWTIGQGVAGIGDSFGFYTGGSPKMTLDTNGVFTVSSHIYASSGYVFAIHFNQSSSNSENPTIAGIWANNAGDNYCRKSTPAHFKNQMGMYHNNGTSTSNRIIISSGTPSGTITDGDVWLQY